MSEISPSPWKANGIMLCDKDNNLIALFDDDKTEIRDFSVSSANASLSAAAPELLAMVKELADDLRKKEQWCARDPVLCEKCGKDETCLILKADKLITKAEGSATCLKR